MTYTIGLTGGIGSGKTAASNWFAEQGICIVDADLVAREVVQANEPTLQKIHHTFGDWVLNHHGELNRQALREYIFTHPDARKTLEQITHPAIRERILNQLNAAKSPYVILVSPLLFETKQHLLTHRTLLIDVPEYLQLQRASHRDHQSEDQIKRIMSTQMPRHEKIELADDIVVNDSGLDQLYQQLAQLHQTYLAQNFS